MPARSVSAKSGDGTLPGSTASGSVSAAAKFDSELEANVANNRRRSSGIIDAVHER
jgi:hypothetical protein